ncbi:MAG: AAA family ATPase [Actinobacteria bacterium]|nr:AAA family ATPase [Actinomycetota bacterium]
MVGVPAQMLGRDAELAVLRDALAHSTTGRCRLLLVSGEAGIGKSRLLDELARDARARDCLTLTGRAAEFESDVPFAVVIDAVDSYLRSLDPNDIDRLATDRLGALAAVFPSLSRLGEAVDVPVNAGERFRVHRAVGELLERLAARQPVLLVLDDLQWADAASLELAAHLAHRPPDGAVLVAFGMRTGSVPEQSQRPLAGIEASDHVTTVEVPPLDRDALAGLIGARQPDEIDRWHDLTRGNPFFALQLARADIVADRAADVDDVPNAVHRSIRIELDALSPLSQKVATAAAVIGDPFHLDLVISAGTVSEDDVLAGLDELCLQGIARPTTTPRVFEFRHPLVRSAIYQATPPGTRIAHHRRVAEQLRARGADPVELARHVEHSARHGDTAAVEVLGRAAASVIASAPASAIRWLTTALSLVPASAPPRARIVLLGHLANAHAAAGDLGSGLEALRRSLSIVPPDDIRALTNVSIAASEGERLLGQPEVAANTLRAAYERIPDRNSPEAARIAIARSANAFYLGTYDDTFKWADEAVRVAEHLDDVSLIVAARTARLAGTAFAGHIQGARELHAELAPRFDGLEDVQLAPLLDTLRALASAELYLDLYPDAYAHATQGLTIARRTGQTHLMPMLTPVAGTAAWMIGKVDAAIEIFDDAIEAARPTGNDAVLAWLLFNRSLPELTIGNVEQALAISEESWRLAEPLAEGMIRGLSAAARASALEASGRPAEAIELLYGFSGGPELSLVGGAWRGVWLEIAVRCHLALGEVEAARAAVERTRALATSMPVDLAVATADRSEAAHALATGDPARAVELLRSAVEHSETMESPVYVAWSRELLGHALEAVGDLDGAVRELSIASEMSDELGTIRHRDRIDADLRRLGQTVHRRTRRGVASAGGLESLTGRELEVAQLIRAHATNRDIANELFLSLKTVETHIRNIFNKLGVSSRGEIARRLTLAESA